MLEKRESHELFCHLKKDFWSKRNHGKNNLTITAWLRWEGTSGDHLVLPPAQAEPLWPTAGFPGSCPYGLLSTSRDRDSITPWVICASAQSPYSRSVSWCSRGTTCVSFCAYCLGSVTGTTGKSLALSSLCPLFNYLYSSWDSPWAFSRLNSPISLSHFS